MAIIGQAKSLKVQQVADYLGQKKCLMEVLFGEPKERQYTVT